MKVLLTGASGRLGRAFVEHTNPSWELDARSHSELDICDKKAVETAVSGADMVLNCAAYTDVDAAESNVDTARDVNTIGPYNLAEATEAAGSLLVHLSTDYVFDGEKSTPYTEHDPAGPLSVYGRSKLAGEQAVMQLNPEHIIIRTAWLYDHTGPSFLHLLLSLASRPEVGVSNDQYGSPTYVPHLVSGIERVVESGLRGTVHLAGSGGASRYELACCLYEKMGFETKLLPAKTSDFPSPATRPAYSILDTSRSPEIHLPPWEEGLEAFVRHTK
ncbi:MAG: dTDP-4-dehydrorhamnose reductase, partial [Myxococcota bacterium]|nr:dTDP-4-dehydrorhamnose reductase [Myxococcota bacterium]